MHIAENYWFTIMFVYVQRYQSLFLGKILSMMKYPGRMIFRQNILITMQCRESHLRVQYQTG